MKPRDPEELRLIAEAVADGKVRVIKPGLRVCEVCHREFTLTWQRTGDEMVVCSKDCDLRRRWRRKAVWKAKKRGSDG